MGRTTEVSCDRCGAPLAIGERARFVTCGYCKARLKVEHSDSAVWTKALEQLKKGHERIAGEQKSILRKQRHLRAKLRVVELERELDEIEERWEGERQRYAVRTKRGEFIDPPAQQRNALFAIGAAAVFGVIMAAMKAEIGLAYGGIAIVPGVILLVIASRRLGPYQSARRAFEERRRELESALEAAKRRTRRRS